MKYVDEFRDPHLITKAADEIRRLADPGRQHRLMEVCGGHTHAIYRFGLKDLLPPTIELVHGPGCPVCVLPMGRIDDGLAMAEDPRVILTAFGDMMRVPGTKGSLLDYKARGCDVRIVYSPLDALRLAQAYTFSDRRNQIAKRELSVPSGLPSAATNRGSVPPRSRRMNSCHQAR